MNPKLFWLLTVILFVSIHRAEAQQATLPKIGWLGARSASAPTREVFRREIRSFGYVEGKNMNIDTRRVSLTAFPLWLMSWCVSKLTCSLRPQPLLR